jgi:hypothetical protein
MIAELGLSCASTKEIVAVADLFALRQNIFAKSKKGPRIMGMRHFAL